MVARMRMLLMLVSPVREKTTTYITCAEYHSSTIVTVSFESLVARIVLKYVGIVT